MNAIPTVVYIVDDDPEVRRALGRLLRAAGYTTRPFGSPNEFLVSGEAQLSAGCIILDLAMPGLNGLELEHDLFAGRHEQGQRAESGFVRHEALELGLSGVSTSASATSAARPVFSTTT